MKQCYLPGWWGATLLIYMSEEVQEPLSTKLKRCKTANLPEWWGAQIFPHSTQKESGILCSGTDQHQPMDNVRGAWPNIYWPPKKYGAPPNINKTQKGLWFMFCTVECMYLKSPNVTMKVTAYHPWFLFSCVDFHSLLNCNWSHIRILDIF